MSEEQESCTVSAIRVDDYGARRYRVTLTVTIHADSLGEAVAAASALIGEL